MARKPRDETRRRGRRRAQDVPDRAGRILAAADRLFCERGYAGVSLSDVAEAAEVNKGLILYYHASKDALFAAVLERYYGAHTEAFAATVDPGAPLRERVHALLDAYFDFMDRNRRYARLVQHEVARSSEHLPLIRRHMADLFAVVEQALGDALPAQGPLAPKQFFLTLSAMTINYYTYAPLLEPLWGGPLLTPAAKAERRAHLHWVADRLLDGVARED